MLHSASPNCYDAGWHQISRATNFVKGTVAFPLDNSPYSFIRQLEAEYDQEKENHEMGEVLQKKARFT